MEISIEFQLRGCLAFFVFGVLASLVFGIFRLAEFAFFRESATSEKSKISRWLLTLFIDILYSVLFSCTFALVSYTFAYGKFRLVNLFCSAVGFALYRISFGQFIEFGLKKLILLLKRFIRRAVCIVLYPFKKLLYLCLHFLKWAYTVTVLSWYNSVIDKKEKRKHSAEIIKISAALEKDFTM